MIIFISKLQFCKNVCQVGYSMPNMVQKQFNTVCDKAKNVSYATTTKTSRGGAIRSIFELNKSSLVCMWQQYLWQVLSCGTGKLGLLVYRLLFRVEPQSLTWAELSSTQVRPLCSTLTCRLSELLQNCVLPLDTLQLTGPRFVNNYSSETQHLLYLAL